MYTTHIIAIFVKLITATQPTGKTTHGQVVQHTVTALSKLD